DRLTVLGVRLGRPRRTRTRPHAAVDRPGGWGDSDAGAGPDHGHLRPSPGPRLALARRRLDPAVRRRFLGPRPRPLIVPAGRPRPDADLLDADPDPAPDARPVPAGPAGRVGPDGS